MWLSPAIQNDLLTGQKKIRTEGSMQQQLRSPAPTSSLEPNNYRPIQIGLYPGAVAAAVATVAPMEPNNELGNPHQAPVLGALWCAMLRNRRAQAIAWGMLWTIYSADTRFL